MTRASAYRSRVDKSLAALGLRFADPDDERAFQAEHDGSMLMRQRVLIGMALVIFLVYAIRDIAIGPSFGYGALYFRLFFILPVLGLSFALTFSEAVRPHFQTVFTALLVIVIAAVGMLSLLYPHYGPTDPAQTSRTMSTMMMTLAIMALSGLRFEQAMLTGVIAVLFWFMGSIAKQLQPDLYPTLALNVVTSFVVGGFVVYWLERAERSAFGARQALVREREKSHNALYATLPRHVVERIARNDRPIAEPFVEAVVVLADLASFNLMSKRIGPTETVRILDHVFTAFDRLAEKYQLQRVRTVGDSYMAVGGTYEGSRGGPREAARMAMEMLTIVSQSAKTFDMPLNVRIGIHVGPLIGGVVGQSSPTYDFWGDTLNVVNELEFSSEAGRIHCSENFYWRLGQEWAFEPRGAREFKGIGTLQTFYLLGPAKVAATAGAVDGA